ncbi:MAG TPA: hypothetical protein VNW06_05210 [Cytophagaceae bacterium]|jgi:hypothetical protein|nr:hypothetical protein [Cytophagaceae bacterium]
MKQLLKLTLILSALVIGSCSTDKTETFIIDEIKVYDSVAENEEIGKDLVSYDYVGIITAYLKITDKDVLKNIAWEYFIENNSQKVTFRLILNEKSKGYMQNISVIKYLIV